MRRYLSAYVHTQVVSAARFPSRSVRAVVSRARGRHMGVKKGRAVYTGAVFAGSRGCEDRMRASATRSGRLPRENLLHRICNVAHHRRLNVGIRVRRQRDGAVAEQFHDRAEMHALGE